MTVIVSFFTKNIKDAYLTQITIMILGDLLVLDEQLVPWPHPDERLFLVHIQRG
jgi:hypothetical protein